MLLTNEIDSLFANIKNIKKICERCLNSQRWQGNVTLMLLDAAFTSVGINYFQVVIPKVKAFEKEFVTTKKITSLEALAKFNCEEAFHIWKNKRSWQIVKEISRYLSTISKDDREALRAWAKSSSLKEWSKDPIGKIKGVGLITYQYLRMMGGIDTVMPDKIVKKVINGILIKAGEKPVYDNMEFIEKIEKLAKNTGYRSIELCFMTWFVNNPERVNEMP